MDSVGVNIIETAALGRPFRLGMLYDCRRDALVPGAVIYINTLKICKLKWARMDND